MADRKLLEVVNLETEFRTEEGIVKAVSGSSFSLNKGETLGIVGESGSGKSVTALSIMQLIPSPPGRIANGAIIYHSEDKGAMDLCQLQEHKMRKIRGNEISMIFQEPMTSLNPVFTCGNQVVEAIRLHQKASHDEAKALTLKLFREVELPDPERIYKAYPHQLSGGQKQRVMIAMAMSCNPNILIADEPTTALDVTVQKTILDLMKGLRDHHDMSIIFITHDLGVIADIADHVMVMYKGHIVEYGSVHQIFTNPQHPYTKGLLACRPPLRKRLTTLPVISDFMDEEAGGRVTEKRRTISEAIERHEVTPKELKKHHDKLYAQEPLLQVRNLKTFFPSKKNFFGKPLEYLKAVNGVSFDVYPGETLGLVGESGCGKTTLGRTILRLIEPLDGTIRFDGKDVRAMDSHELRKLREEMQIIFQDPYSSLNPRLTIGSAIMEPMQVHGIHENNKVRKEQVIELLEKVNMQADHFSRYPHEFSGGQRQRICIARALALDPTFIVCDESVSALDVSVQAQVLNLLNKLKKEFGFTYIFISHDLSVVKFMSDRMIVMNNGKIEELGLAEDIYNNPQKAYTKKLIDAIPTGEVVKRRKRKSVSK